MSWFLLILVLVLAGLVAKMVLEIAMDENDYGDDDGAQS